MKKALLIVGPTGIGKTDLAVYLSKKFPSTLISADSIQVYRGADIISGKDRSVPTYLVDVLSPSQSFSVREFIEKVRPLVEKAKKENKLPIIVGGTGFYIDALFGKIETINIPPNQKLRKKLEKLSIESLQKKLKKTNPHRFGEMNNSDRNNKRRLIRALEISLSGDRSIDHYPIFKEDEVLFLGLKDSMENLKKRIALRVEQRLQSGALREARRLFKNYEKLSTQIKAAVGYKQLFDFLAGRIIFEKAVQKWVIAEAQLAKKQTTWLKRNRNIVWFNIGQRGFEAKILRLIKHEFPS